MPRLGTRKLHYLLKPVLEKAGIGLGRDKLFSYLRQEDLLVPCRRRYIKTTDSRHWMRKYPNIAAGLRINGPEQLWVSDITYLKTLEGNMYLSLVTDAFSRRIMGYNLSESLAAVYAVKAFQMAIDNRQHLAEQLVHHSDRGLQYCSREYVETAVSNGIRISMTENGDPYENALAERMNRTLKEEFRLDEVLPDKSVLVKSVRQAIKTYNRHRPHLALNMQVPEQMHKKSRSTEANREL